MTETNLETVRSQDPLEALTEIAAARAMLETEAEICVRRARHTGATWQQIADALGVSRQAAYQKYAGRRGVLGRIGLSREDRM